MEELDEFLTLAEVRKIFHISKKTQLRWRKEGRLTDIYPDGKPPPEYRGKYNVKISKAEVMALMETMKANV